MTELSRRKEACASDFLELSADARLLIVNCDDFGMYGAVNAAVVEAITHGVATTCSLMAPCPAAADAVRLLQQNPAIPFGVHLTLICELSGHRWGPLAPREQIPSLLDHTGELFDMARRDELLARARLDELEIEFRTQIGRVLDAGLEPTHLDWHCLSDGGRDDIFELVVGLAAEYGLGVRTVARRKQMELKRDGLPANDHPLLDSFSLDLDGKAARYASLLRDLPTGLSEWAVHPSLGDTASRSIDPDGWRVRRSDYEFLVSRGGHAKIVEEAGVTLLDYRPLQAVWRRRGPARHWWTQARGC